MSVRATLRVSRRRFLRFLTGAGAASLIPWLAPELSVPGGMSGAMPGGGTDGAAGGGLTGRDLAELSALAAVLHPPRSDRERRELDGTIRWWATGRVARGGRLPVYRAGLAELREGVGSAGGGNFDELSPAARGDLVAELHGGAGDGAFHRLAEELLEGVYATDIGWRVVGYRVAPGTPSGVLQYTRPPAPAPELAGVRRG